MKNIIIGVLLLGAVGCGSECQWCRESVKAKAIVCPHCLRDEPIPIPRPEPAPLPPPKSADDEKESEAAQ